jgi:hypothetical protein
VKLQLFDYRLLKNDFPEIVGRTYRSDPHLIKARFELFDPLKGPRS